MDGYVENIWYVAVGDPSGEYVMSVELEDGRMRRFVFRLGPPVAAAAEAI